MSESATAVKCSISSNLRRHLSSHMCDRDILTVLKTPPKLKTRWKTQSLQVISNHKWEQCVSVNSLISARTEFFDTHGNVVMRTHWECVVPQTHQSQDCHACSSKGSDVEIVGQEKLKNKTEKWRPKLSMHSGSVWS